MKFNKTLRMEYISKISALIPDYKWTIWETR